MPIKGMNEVNGPVAAIAAPPALIDAEQILDFVWSQPISDRVRQLVHFDRTALPIEAERDSALSCVAVEIHLLWLKTESRADSVRRVVNDHLADA
jgi:hypothetical protein